MIGIYLSRGHGHGVYLVSGPGPGLLEKRLFCFFAFCDHDVNIKRGALAKTIMLFFLAKFWR